MTSLIVARACKDQWYEPGLSQNTVFYMRGWPTSRSRRETHVSRAKSKSAFFRFVVIIIPFAICGLVGWWFTKKSGLARGTIRLPDRRSAFHVDLGPLATLASVPFFLLGLVGIAWEYVASWVPTVRSQRGYRTVPVDEDAQVVQFEHDQQKGDENRCFGLFIYVLFQFFFFAVDDSEGAERYVRL